jgi:hypothetical protein
MPTKIVVQEGARIMDTLETGVEATTRLAIGEDVEGATGRHFDRLEEAAANPQAYDPEARRRLWELTLELTGAPDVG